MSKKYVVNIFQCIVSAITAVILLIMAAYCMASATWIPCLVLAALGVLFLSTSVVNGMYIVLTEEGVERRFFGKKIQLFKWTQIKEVGVVGLKIFGKPQNTGTRYIYFSKEKLNEKTRFDMCLQWSPKDKIYMTWDAKRLLDVQSYWNAEIAEYNAGNIGI